MSVQFIREDWKLFRSIETLCQKAGVHKEFIPVLVVKELVDNALDASGGCQLDRIDEHTFIISDQGAGINPELLPLYFSINRPLMSSKMLRLPTRGALGNGLRVVTGAVIATGGELSITTKGRIYNVIPQDDGSSVTEDMGSSDEVGTSIRIKLGIKVTDNALSWGRYAINLSKHGELYSGKTSMFWYNSESFYELINAIDILIVDFLNLQSGTNKQYLKELNTLYEGKRTSEFTFEDSEILLKKLRYNSKKISPKRLGEVGDVYVNYYSKVTGEFKSPSSRGDFDAFIPFVVEVWINTLSGDPNKLRSQITLSVNKTPITADYHVNTKQAQTSIWGAGLDIEVKSRPVKLEINIITPYMPITSDGKAPNFRPMNNEIETAVKRAVAKMKKEMKKDSSGGRNEREVILDNLDDAIYKTSGYGEYRFSQRQLFYAIRPIVMEAFDNKEPNYNYFCHILSEYENEHGEIENMYRDARGTLYHPHTKEEIPLGTLNVRRYARPTWTFNKIIFIEKEGYFEILKDVNFPEKYDCALVSSKGFASRAVKDIFDLLGDTDEEIQFFCVHDADAAGTKIFETLQEATLARPSRRVRVINLGLEPEEAVDMGLQVETFNSKGRRPVADYVDYSWTDWLQSHRVELNSMTTPQFIQWMEDKMEEHGVGKVVPSQIVLEIELEKNAQEIIRQNLIQKLLDENNFNNRLQEEISGAKTKIDVAKNQLRSQVTERLYNSPEFRWDQPIQEIARKVVQIE